MLGIMEDNMKAKPCSEPLQNTGLMKSPQGSTKVKSPQGSTKVKSPQGATKVKSSTIDMFFKSPPKQPPAKPNNILGYFKPASATKVSKTDTKVSKTDTKVSNSDGDADKSKVNGKTDVDVKKVDQNQTKKEGDIANKNKSVSGEVLVNGKKKKTIKAPAKSKSKGREASDKVDKAKSSSTKSNRVRKNEQKVGKNKVRDSDSTQQKGSDVLEDGNDSLNDFDTAKTENQKKVETTNTDHQKENPENDSKSSEITLPKAVQGETSHKVIEKNSCEISTKESNSVSNQDFLDVKNKKEALKNEGKDKEISDCNTDDADTVVISYADFLSQSSADDDDDEEEIERKKPVKNDNENNHLSEDLLDVDMADASTEESAVSMETDVTSDDDIFQDQDESKMAATDSSSNNALKLSVNSCGDAIVNSCDDAIVNSCDEVIVNKKSQKDNHEATTNVKPSSQDKPEKNEKYTGYATTNGDDEELCMPKRKEVKVTAQVHTPPIITPATSPSASPSNSTSKLKSNVVVDVTDLDLEAIHVEETDVNGKPSSPTSVVEFSSRDCSTANSESCADISIKPAPTKVFSIFQKKSATKDASQPQNNDQDSSSKTLEEDPKGQMKSKDSKLKKATKKTSEDAKSLKMKTSKDGTRNVEKGDLEKVKLSLTKSNKKDSISNSTKLAEGKEIEGNKQKDEPKGKKRRLSLNKNKQEPKESPVSSRRQSSRRASAVKARKDILEQELQREAVGSESATSQEDVAPPRKKSLKELFPSATDTDASEQGDKARGKTKTGRQATPGRGRKKLTKQTAMASDAESDATKVLDSPKVGNKKVGRRKSQPLADLESDDDGDETKDVGPKAINKKVGRRKSQPLTDLASDDSDDDETKVLNSPKASGKKVGKRKTKQLANLASDDDNDETNVLNSPKKESKRKSQPEADLASDEVPKKKRGRPKKVIADGRLIVKIRGPVMTSSPKVNKTKSTNKKTKAKELLQKAKTIQAAKASPSKAKKPQTKSHDSTIEILNSSNEVKPVKTLKNFKDVLGKKTVAKGKEVDLKKKKKSVPLEGAKKDEGGEIKTGEGMKRQRHDDCVTIKPKKKTNPNEPKKVPANLCPLFTKEGRIAAAKKQAAMIEANSQSSQDALITLSDDDSCDTRLGQDGGACSGPLSFSGLISAVKQKDQEKKAQDLPYPAFSAVSHVLQKDETISQFWNLPKVTLPLVAADKLCTAQRVADLNRGMVTLCGDKDSNKEKGQLQHFTAHTEFTQDTQKLLLEDICKSNPKVAVRKLFKRYLAKSKGDPPPTKSTQDKAEKQFTGLKPEQKSGKRKSEAILDDNDSNNRRKRSRQDAGDTDVGSRCPRRYTKSKEEEHKELRRSKRKSTHGKEEVKVQESSKVNSAEQQKDEATLKAEKLASMLWTEKYQPSCAVEVIGNTNNVKKLSSWLDEWRKRFVKEKKKMKKQQRKTQPKKGDKDRADSEDDFMTSDSSDSDSDYSDEEDFLCNTMLISGPAGSGKTAALNACAQEYGFKVFEVNAASKRIGRQILSELGEATQSHHVAAKPGITSGINAFFKPGPKMSPGKSPSKKKDLKQGKKPPMPKAFANFFKTTSTKDQKTTKDSPKSKTKASKKKGKEEPPAVTMTTKKTEAPTEKTIPSTSIIVFEEVDVVFEEDRGFLAAITSFMETTKRPIILTTSDPQFAANFEGRFESLVFKKPSTALLATHLQLAALAENVFTSPQDMKLVAQYLECDIRKSITALQYWISSGAKRTCAMKNSTEKVSKNPKLAKKSAQQSNGNKTVDKLDLEDKIDILGEYYESKVRSPGLERRFHDMLDSEATRHDCCLECIMGVRNQMGLTQEMTRILQSPKSPSTIVTQSSVAETYQHQMQSEMTYNNFYNLLHQSNDKTASNTSHTPKLGKKLVANTAAYLDNLSNMDAIFPDVHNGIPPLSCRSNQGYWQAQIKASMLDLPGDEEEQQNGSHFDNLIQSEIRSIVEVLSFTSCNNKYQRLLKESRNEAKKTENGETSDESKTETEAHDNGLPGVENTDAFRLRPQETNCPDVYPVVIQRLPNHVYCSHESLALDYLPAVRQICRQERWRQEAALKRRFLHYLDYSGIGLKSTDYLKLASALDVHPHRPPQEDSFLSAI